MRIQGNDVTGLLRQAEQGLLRLVADAAGSGDYEAIERARAAAHGVRGLIARLEPPEAPRSRNGDRRFDGHASRPSGAGRSGREKEPKAGYPQFALDRGTLVKTGWSKKDRREYEHKTDAESFDRVVAAMASLAVESKGPHTAEDIADAVASDGHASMPIYKLYVALSFLRHVGLARQMGKEGYEIDRSVGASGKDALRGLMEHARMNGAASGGHR